MTLALVLASNNRGKLTELEQLLAPYRVIVYPQSKFVAEGADETGVTFRENALLKARHAARASGLPAIADDSGIEVDALNGAPGVYSARYAGATANDEDNNRKLLAALADVPKERRNARYRCVLAYVRAENDPLPLVAEGVWEGRVLEAPRGSAGFGYDPLFLPNHSASTAVEMTAAEMTAEAKNAMSHRGQALRMLLRLLVDHGEIRT